MKKLIIVLVMLFTIGASLFAGPFGIDFGMTLEQVKNVATINSQGNIHNYMYFITPIKKSGLFTTYRVSVSPKYGVFDITAAGNNIVSDEYGEKIRDEFLKVSDLVSQTYGSPSGPFDRLKSGSIWDEPRDWLTSLRKGERTYVNYWSVNDGLQLPVPLGIIALNIKFLNDYGNECYLLLT